MRADRTPRAGAERDRVERAPDQLDEQEHAPPARRAPLLVGAANDPAEHAADALAERALRRLADAAAPLSGREPAVHRASSGAALAGEFEADDAVSERVTARLGRGDALPTGVRRSMERGFGTDLAGVRVHADPEAGRLADSLGAEAFTYGRDIFFGAGRYRPDALSGQQLLAHELAHVVQSGGSAVQRKLKGTLAAVKDQGGEAEGKGGVKGMFVKGDYPKILSKLKEYEAREEKVFSKGAFAKGDKEWMLKTLAELTALIDGWVARHEQFGDAKGRKKRNQELMGLGDEHKDAAKAGDTAEMDRIEAAAAGSREEQQVRTLNMLRPRLAAERQDLMSPNYFAAKAFNDATLDKGAAWNKDDAVGGAANRLDQVQHGGKQGYFIPDKANNLHAADAAMAAGIDRLDPNQGARSVASSRLAKLFGATVVANIDFATHQTDTNIKGRKHAEKKNTMGVVSEKAEGTEGGKLALARSKEERAEYEKDKAANQVIDMDDPELQRSLNILQMLDYISLQLDRHAGNFYIATDDNGKVIGVTGIDLDISFGKQGKDGKVTEGGHFVGVPELADAEFRAKVLSVKPEEIRACLDGLLSPGEVDATIERFTYLCDVLKKMDPRKVVKAGGWGAETAKEQGNDTSYLGKLKQTTVQHAYDDKIAPIMQPLTTLTFEYTAVRTPVQRLVDGGQLTPGQGIGLLEAIVHAIMNDPGLVRKRQVANEAKDYEQRVQTAVKSLNQQKEALLKEGGNDADTRMMRVEAQLIAAELEKDIAPTLTDAAKGSYKDAVEAMIKNMAEFAVRFASRQKRAMTPVKRPAKV